MPRVAWWVVTSLLFGCSSANFDVASATDGGQDDSGDGSSETGAPPGDGDPLDTYTPPPDSGCVEVTPESPDVFVDLTAPAGGKGTSGCPFRKLSDAAAAPLAPGTARVVHVSKGAYSEASFVRVRPGETYRGEGGVAKLVGGGGSDCPGTDEPCVVLIDGGGKLEGFWIEGATYGVVMIAATNTPPVVSGTTVRGAVKAGIFVGGTTATIGPGMHVDSNLNSGVIMKGSGKLSITGAGNTFDSNAGAFGTAGIVMFSGQLSIDGGSSASNNNNGVLFDASGLSTAEHVISQLVAQGNRNAGVALNKAWGRLVVRKSTLTKNANFGLQAVLLDNTLDLGTAGAPGNNVFGGLTGKNTKAGIMLCNSGDTGSVKADANKWSLCPLLQVKSTSCDAPAAYADVAYVARAGAPDPIATPSACAVGP